MASSIAETPAKPRRQHKPRVPVPDALLTSREAATRLACSIKTLTGHVEAGALSYVVIGHGSKRPRKMFTAADLDTFITDQTRKEIPCPSTEPRSPYWQFDFQWRGHRFHGSTKATTRREAEKVEAAEREKAKHTSRRSQAARTSLRLDDVAGRYWQEVGQHHVGAPQHRGDELARLIGYSRQGQATHRDHRRRHGQAGRMAARASIAVARPADLAVHRERDDQTTRKLFTRAKMWGVRFDHEPRWRNICLKEPHERVRELAEHEADQLEAATRDDLAPFFAFARASGLRLRECLLRWDEVDWGAQRIRKLGKGGKLVTVSITPTIREILWPLRGHHPEHVFTFVADRTVDGRVKGGAIP